MSGQGTAASAPVVRHGDRALPWLEAPFERLARAHRAGRLAHGLLLSGPPGVGKRALAEALARAWLCENAAGASGSCGSCRSCRLSAAGNHPDFTTLQPAEGRATIAVDQVRELAEGLSLQSHAGGSKVAVIAPAQAMTVAAQNSLLKTLEEPAGSAILVLLSESDAALAATIRSRCQRIAVHAPAPENALAWLLAGRVADERSCREALELSGNAPLAAQRMIEEGFVAATQALAEDLAAVARGRAEPVAVAGAWDEKHPREAVLVWLQGIVLGLLRQAAAGSSPEGRTDSQRIVAEACGTRLSATALSDFLRELNAAAASLRGQASPRLVLESVLIGWAAVTRPVRTGRSRRPG